MSQGDREVTDQVAFGTPDDEHLPVRRCLCGHEPPRWQFVLSIYRDTATPCPVCGARLYFSQSLQVFQVTETEPPCPPP